jgi:hypothetical protein
MPASTNGEGPPLEGAAREAAGERGGSHHSLGVAEAAAPQAAITPQEQENTSDGPVEKINA